MSAFAPRSLFAQFLVLHVAVALVAVAVLLGSASMLLHQTANHFQHDLLRHQAEIVAAAHGRGERDISPILLTDGMAVAVVDRDRRIEGSSGPARPRILAAAPLEAMPRFFRRGAIEGISVPAGARWVIASQNDTDPEVVTDDIVRTFLGQFALVCLPIAALVPLLGEILARRLTRRLRRVSAIAATIGPRSSATRLPVGLLPVEVEPLARATNAALDRLAEALHVQAAFAADVAHELRTPLAVIRLRADAIPDAGLRGEITAATDRAARVIAQLLALAELERPLASDAVPIGLVALAEDVIADRAPGIIAGGRHIALEGGGDTGDTPGYREAIVLALENLIGNATKHTPPGTNIVVRTGPGPRFSVADDGPGVPDAQMLRLKDRLWRGDAHGVEGSGIGLSIVDRIARAHGGALVIERGADGRGLVFHVTLADPAPL